MSETIQNKGGLTCEKCKTFIPMTIDMLFVQSTLTCPGCLTVYTLNMEASKEALDAAKKMKVALDNLEESKKFKNS